jgi:hypothetical protein
MLYPAIDQHRKQLTVNLRGEHGDMLLRRRAGTQWPRRRIPATRAEGDILGRIQ